MKSNDSICVNVRLTEFIREKDVLKQWPMSKATLIRARKKGLPFVRLGAFVCYRPEDLEAHFCQPRSWTLEQVGTKKREP